MFKTIVRLASRTAHVDAHIVVSFLVLLPRMSTQWYQGSGSHSQGQGNAQMDPNSNRKRGQQVPFSRLDHFQRDSGLFGRQYASFYGVFLFSQSELNTRQLY